MTMIFVVLAALCTLLLAQEADKSDATQDVPHGKINWTKQYVYATGSGAPDLKAPNVTVARLGAERVARADAYRNLLEAIKGVSVTGSTTLKNSMEESMDVKTSVEGVIKGMEIVTTKYYSDGGVDVVVRVPLSALSDKVSSSGAVDKEIATKESVKAATPVVTDTPAAKGDKKTVLVFDLRGAKFTPALFPVVYTEDGKILYSKKQVRDEVLKTTGMIHYIKDDLDSVTMMYGDAASMLVLKISKVKNKSDLIVGANDLSAIQSKLTPDAMSEGKVVILF
jgi:hypothetical protein